MPDANLRTRLIRLAHTEPAMRPHILPLLHERVAREFGTEDALKEYLKEHPNADPSRHTVVKPSEGASSGKDKAPKKHGIEFSDAEKNLPSIAHQPVKDPDKLFKHAEEAHEQQLKWLNRGKGLDKMLGAEVKRCDKKDCEVDYDKPGPVIVIGPTKTRGRSQEKVEADFGGDWSRLNDIVRASVAVDSMDDIGAVMSQLRAAGLKLAKPPKDRFANPTDVGYRDLLMNVEYPNGHVGELQIHLKPILKAKEKGHKHYEDMRSISAKAKMEGRETLSDEEQSIVDKASKAMTKLYEDAFAEATGGKGKSAASDRSAADVRYYDFDGFPARWETRKFPVKVVAGGKDVVIYELDKFFERATQVEKSEYDKAVRELKDKGKKSKKGGLREAVIRLAASNPAMQPHLLTILRSR